MLISGWSLGEHAEWAKYSNFDIALRVPLLISIPHESLNYSLKNVSVEFSKNTGKI